MTFSSMGDANKFKDIQRQLEAQDVNKKTHLGIIKDTADDLFSLFDTPDRYAEIDVSKNIDHEEDLKLLDTTFQKKIDLLENSESITLTSIENRYKKYKDVTTGNKLNPGDKDKLKANLEGAYDKAPINLSLYFNGLPKPFSKFRDGLRKTYFSKIEKTSPIDKVELNTICTNLQAAAIIKSPVSPELALKLTKLLLVVSQIDQCLEKGSTDKHLGSANYAFRQLEKTLRQLQALESLHKTKDLVGKRLSNLAALDHKNPSNLKPSMVPVETPVALTINLENIFIQDKTKLDQVDKEYTLNKASIIGSDGKERELFADNMGTALGAGLKTGTTKEMFVKEGDIYVSIGNLEVKDHELIITSAIYSKLPAFLQQSFGYKFNIQGLAASKGGMDAPVSITKDVTQTMDKPNFDPEYDEIEDEYKINEKLSLIFDEQYESQLKDRFYEVLSKDPQCMVEWAKFTEDEKNDFFKTVIAGGTPTWADGRAVPAELTRAACYTKAEYYADIKKRILEGFTGKTKPELKKYIFDKLGTLDFTELGKNPYAIKVLADSIRKKLTSKVDDAFYLLNHYALATRFAHTHTAPEEELPDGSKAGEKVLDAAVADSKEIYKEGAYERAQKQLEEYYKSGARFGLKRAKVFFFRGRMVEKAMAKELKNNKGMHIDSTSNAAVNRWMLEQAMGGEFAANIRENTTVFDDVVFQDRLNNLVEKYLKNSDSSADTTFANDIQSLIMSNTQLKIYMKENNITHLGTNLVEQAKAEKEERNYYGQLINIINQYTTDGSLNKPQEFEVAIRKQLADFAQKQNRLPDMIKHLNLKVDEANFAEKIANHKITLERMKMRNVKLRLRLLTNKSEDEKGLTTAQDVNRDKFDATHGKKLTKWMEKHPWWTTSITAVGLVGAGVVGTLTAPVLGAGIGAGMLWYMNFLKKRGHYTEEHKKFEQHILAMTPAEREKYLEDMKEKSDKMPKALRWVFSSEYTKYGRSMEYITRADSMEKVMGDLDKYINNPKALTTTEKTQFETYLKDAVTLLQMHKVEGRNFMFGENGKAKLEEQYNLLHQKTLAGLRRYDGTLNPEDVISSLSASVHAHVTDLQDEYDKEKKDMKKMRTKLGIFAGTKSAAIYLGTAWLGGLIKNGVVDGWNHVFGNHSAAATAPTPGHTTIGPQFQGLDQAFGSTPNGTPDGHLLLKNVFNNDTAKYQQLVDKIQHLPTSDHTTTLRGSLKDIFGTDQLANAKTHEIFNQFAANITDHNVQELVSQGANVNIHSAQQIAHLMSNRGYSGTNVDAGQIQSLINGFKSGAINLNNLPVGWTKETACNALFCNTQGHQLTDLFFDAFVKKAVIPGTPGSVVPPVSPVSGANSNFLPFGLPTFFNEIRNKK